MIIQSNETKGQASLIDLLGGNNKSSTQKSNDLFSKLLASLSGQAKGESKLVSVLSEKSSSSLQNSDFKAVIDPKKTIVKSGETKSAALNELQSLLIGDEKESTLLSKELIDTLSSNQVRPLIHQAKEYLKNEITAKAPEYKADPKSLPKTLIGLVQLADKLGLKPQEITLSTIAETIEQNTFSPELLTKPLLETKTLAQLSKMPEEAASFEAITQLLNQTKNKEPKEAKTASTEPSVEHSSEKTEKTESQPLKTLLQTLNKRDPEITAVSTDPKVQEVKTAVSAAAAPTNAKSDNLLALLQGEETKEGKSETGVTHKHEGELAKAMQAPKADSLEVKGKEAQQSMRHFATDLKEAVENYKPPFTRLTMKLNPEKLGEVEVTLVQRGNNVHVNIQSSNTNSVAFLAHNATELKAQLAHQGITNATMNFMSGDGQTQGQQQQNQQQQNRFKTYQSFEELEFNEEQIAALEIIIPHYA